MQVPGTDCATCGGPATIPVARNGKWTYLRCENCRSLELFPTPTEIELEAYYNSAYSVPSDAYRKTYEMRSHGLLELIKSHCPSQGKLLEVGCSHGTFLLQAREHGWDVRGIELSDGAAQNARGCGLNVSTGTLESEGASLEDFDCIVAWHVIEHIVDIKRFLTLVRLHLRPNGILAL